MDTNLFTERSLWTMLHGIVLSGTVLMALAAALFTIRTLYAGKASDSVLKIQAKYVVWLLVSLAIFLWLTVLAGTYISFPPYRMSAPEGLTDLRMFPKELLLSIPGTVWLHTFAMETKEHVPWIAAMLATTAAFISVRYKSVLLNDAQINKLTSWVLAFCLVLVMYAAILGVLINKVAPLD